MGFQTSDALRLPLIIAFDALVSQRIEWIWEHGMLFGYTVTFIGITVSLGIFACKPKLIVEAYRLMVAFAIYMFIHFWNFSVIKILHSNFHHTEGNASMISRVVSHIRNDAPLTQTESDFIAKLSFCLVVLQTSHWIFLCVMRETLSPLYVMISTWPVLIVMAAPNLPPTAITFSSLLCELPNLQLIFLKLKLFKPTVRFPRRNGNEIIIDDIITWIQAMWTACRVPSVLRLFFIFRCAWASNVILREERIFSTNEYDPTVNSGLYYFFSSSPPAPRKSLFWEDWDGIDGYFITGDKHRNLSFIESIPAILTDSLISSFSVGAAISVIGHHVGAALHDFVGGNDIMHGKALGMMSSILFSLLAIQTGLSSLPAWKRIVRLYRNSYLLLSAILHFFLDVVHPVLMTVSPQSHIPLKKHISPLLVCFVLLVIPSIICYWLITTKPLSTWMIALTAFNLELIMKVISTLLVYALYVIDSRYTSNGIVNLDEYVFWIRSISHIIEFICGLIMFVNGAYILFFESSNLLRAIMMSMHAYINIYRTFKEGVKTLNIRRTVNNKISTLHVVEVDEITDQDRDVCSICYQDLDNDNGEIRRTNCNHMFHFQCLRKWIFIQDTCPMCDRALFPSENADEDKKD